MTHLVSVVLFLPLVGLCLLLLIPGSRPALLRGWATAVAAVTLATSCFLTVPFTKPVTDYAFLDRAAWIPSIGAQYIVGVDGISLLLVLLSTLITLIAIIASANVPPERTKLYYAMILLLETAVLGVFVSLDLFLFYLFWDLVLIPMYFIIGIFGGANRSTRPSSFSFTHCWGVCSYCLGSSACTFIRPCYRRLHFRAHEAHAGASSIACSAMDFLGYVPGVCRQGSNVSPPYVASRRPRRSANRRVGLAGEPAVKMGTYAHPLLIAAHPPGCLRPSVVNGMVVLSLIAIIYGALICLMQRDWKKLVAYSSVSHWAFARWVFSP